MTAVNPVVIAITLALALLVASKLFRYGGGKLQPAGSGRYLALDGLRGYLAFFVFLHHSCIWYFYLKTGRWELPPSNLLVMLGQGSVALFFMVTSFLFTTKVLNSKVHRIDWFQLYLSRVARLFPLYMLTVGMLLLFVAIRSNWTLSVSLESLIDSVFKWLAFTINGKPDINGIQNTSIMVASVTWSLPFEWFFYLCLPLLAVCLSGHVSLRGVVFSCFALYLMFGVWTPKMIVLSSFLGGMLAAVICRYEPLKKLLADRWFSFVALALLLVVIQLPSAYDSLALVLLSLVFIIVAAGNRLFGVLDNSAARWMGELSYGIYLLHGLVLFFIIHFVLGLDVVSELAPLAFWSVICLITPLVLIAAHLAHLGVERPAMSWIKRRSRGRAGASGKFNQAL
ncbi:acyltransferase family protein [Pseudomonas sp. B392_1p]|uniref:acyltransferase family protein n=1 Tax=Pseudomonas sp. B392_1p TaxID=3457507 RepID=UPI003FCFDB3B